MLTVDGRKMAKSLGNFVTLEEMFTGRHPRLERGFDPMVLRFFMLQSHYRSTIDFSSEALEAAERGYTRLMAGLAQAERLLADELVDDAIAAATVTDPDRRVVGPREDPIALAGRLVPLPEEIPGEDDHAREIARKIGACWEAIADDFHTPRTIAALFELVRATQRPEHHSAPEELRRAAARGIRGFVRSVLGLSPDASDHGSAAGGSDALAQVIQIVIDIRRNARSNRDFQTADMIRDRLHEAGIALEDRPDGTTTWAQR
jgi:cysteinyl-tRNA synthetase